MDSVVETLDVATVLPDFTLLFVLGTHCSLTPQGLRDIY